MLGEGDTVSINESVGAPEKKKLIINLSKAKAKSCLSLHYNGDNSYLLFNGQETMLNQRKCHLNEMFMVFQSIMMLAIAIVSVSVSTSIVSASKHTKFKLLSIQKCMN